MRAGRLLVIVLGAAVAGACSLTTSLEGLTGGDGEPDAVAPDAAPDVSSSDATTAEGSSTFDAGMDASDSDAPDVADAGASAPDAGGLPEASAIALVSALDDAYGIALDPDFVYFTTTGDGRVGRVAKDGGAAEYYAVDAGNVQGVAVDSTYVYWSDIEGTALTRCEVSDSASCLASRPAALASTSAPDQIVSDGTFVYWTSHVASGDVYRNAAVLGDLEPIAPELASPAGIALDGTTLVFVETGGGRVDAIADTAIDGTPTVITAAATEPFRVVASGGIAYWTDQGSDTVSSASESSGATVSTLAKGLTMPMGVALDPSGEVLAWVDRGAAGSSTGMLWWCALLAGGCATKPAAFAVTQDQPTSVALDDTSVYWTTRTAVMKAPR